ncbi:HAD family hydrolase [Ruegeria sediminis]|uniref:HAD family hydrolase n=1 Tax=Ruegeria sediminis TaxID=2583820 RepID=A0ABY2WTK7_9RHOB|nr:HAD-IA family hydrolase [Ruegeria sediminis]TMV03283.1 HAD family hydrolase [Ruegeria sediminis]
MSASQRLILFDVDGTLVDSQGSIVSAMSAAFDGLSLPVPERARVLSVVGLSLPHAMARLASEQGASVQGRLVEAYKEAYHAQRVAQGAASSPLYPGALDVLRALHSEPGNLLGVATGKSQRGLDALLEAHGLEGYFVTRQVADHHPSKPHPSMIDTARAETGAEPASTVMIGDTSFDMEMAKAAGVTGIGVSWGYHSTTALADAASIIDAFDQLPPALEKLWN